MIESLMFRDSPKFLGRWELGAPVGSAAFERLPKAPPPATAKDEREKLDLTTADRGLALKPRRLFDAWAAARTALNAFALADNKLTARGYTHSALKDALWRESGADTLATLRETAGVVADAAQYVEQTRMKIGTEYFEAQETDSAQAVFDVALAQAYAAADHIEKQRLRIEADGRLLAALSRTPTQISGITAEDLNEMRQRYVEVKFPHSTAMLDALDKALQPPLQTVREGLRIISQATGKAPQDLVAGWGAAGALALKAVQ